MKWTLFAHKCEPGKDGRGKYRHIGHRKYVEIHHLPHPIVSVNVTEDDSGDYWGWLETSEETPKMIWPSKAQFNCYFPYGAEVEVKKGRGRVLKLKICENQS